jgi:asparagine synthase (glutamine-hydrolysing)
MSAFAAVLHKHHDAPPIEGIAGVLASVTGRPAASVLLGRCALAAAPLHADDPAGPVRTSSGTVLVGRVGDEQASAMWDPREQTLECTRDGLGIRLLYVADASDAIVVTNVLGAALRYPGLAKALDEAALIAFLVHGDAADDVRTCYRDVKVVPPGHTLTIDARSGRARLRRHWHFPLPDGIRRTATGILDEYRSLLETAVRDRLGAGATSIFLSGGIDSTTIAAAAASVAAPESLQAITARYPRYVDDGELPFTQAAAGRLQLPLTVFNADQYGPWHTDPRDPPVAAPLDEPTLGNWRDSLAAAAQHGTVALYGEDGDAVLRPPGWRGLRNSASLTAIGAAAARYAIGARRRPYLGLRWRERVGIVPHRGLAVPAWIAADARDTLARTELATVLGCAPEPLPPHPTRPEAQAVLTSTTVSRHFAATIAPETTRRAIELRFPLLDTRLIRFVMSVPAIPWCQDKALPRRAYKGRLPDAVLTRPKTPLNGFNEGIVAAWRMGRPDVRRPQDPIAEWIDVTAWRRALEDGTPEAVLAAWRVSALDEWLARRASTACTR